jgi:hypothetical protein
LLNADGHVCGFFHSEDEQYSVLMPFIKEGLDNGERAWHVIDPARRDEHVRRLGEAGIDVGAAEARGQFVLLDWSQTYLQGGGFNQDRTMAAFAKARNAGRQEGFPRTRFLCDMEWGLTGTYEQVAEYEATSNFVPLDGDVAICAYKLNRWSANVMMAGLRTHPLVIIGGLLHENPFYQQPGEVLMDLKAGRVSGSACC